MIDWSKTHVDTMALAEIFDRLDEQGIDYGDRHARIMDMQAASLHITIDWDRMKAGRIGDIVHDFSGIRQHLDRETGELKDGFLPRFAVASAGKGG